LGLGNDWAYNVISMIGNYGEMYERHVGLNTPLQLQREGSPNALWTKGGLHYPMPFR
ncbi:MAG: amino acid ABC transporter substrate-binding protein, partial [Deltaproteobacteria bacterium]|nr:amino acid ABC transporter substrate-binding protein [Deltaproteobacteria bacterium]